jgi:hypothetical protein
MASAPATCIAVGIVSFDDWQRLTSSFGWTVAPSSRFEASRAMTSLKLVFVEVPEPVW